MEPFLEPYNYYFLREQTQVLAQTHRSVNDRSTIQAVRSLAFDAIKEELSHLTQEELAAVMAIEKLQIVKEKSINICQHCVLLSAPLNNRVRRASKKLLLKLRKFKCPIGNKSI